MYLFGVLFLGNFVLVFIITILLLAADFYYLKNIAGRRLVGLRWWNEVNTASGDSHWVFESSDPNERVVNKTDSRFFWMALYVQPVCWVGLAVLAITHPVYLSLIGEFCLPGGWAGSEEWEWRRGWVGLRLMAGDSYCAGAYDHEHAGVFAVR